ncbi:MAG: glycosyltransferase family 4 protein [Nitrososphaera sp.]|nr:glycosyltransferase family 4 protein [Nitrososphaera sp.]
MIANVLHISLNARGGAEGLAARTIEALSSIGFDVELGTFERPDPILMRETFGDVIENAVKKVKTLNQLSQLTPRMRPIQYDLTINTHGDMLPYYRPNFSRSNSIVYCHYPLAGCRMDASEPEYMNIVSNLSQSGMTQSCHQRYLDAMKDSYRNMMLSSMVLTNSEFSRKAIRKLFGIDSTVVHPPVDVDLFRKAAVWSNGSREDRILVISRFHPSKKIENAIQLAYLLKRNDLGRLMYIVGNISPDGIDYYRYLRALVKILDLEAFIRFETNVGVTRLGELMGKSKVYLNPMPGEPFGISTVEAMSAGLVPVVPDLGGHVEFVPKRYHFHTFGQAIKAVGAALEAPTSERSWMSNYATRFSARNYIKKFQKIVSGMLDIKKTAPPPSVIPVPTIYEDTTLA